MDEHWASRVVDMEESGDRKMPGTEDDDDMSPLGYSDVVGRLDLIADRILTVRTAVQAGYSKNHEEPSIKHWMPRPVTAIERERERRARIVLLEVDALVLGDGVAIT